MFKLQYPIKDFNWKLSVSQLFGVNRKLYEKNFGIPGHNGIDFIWRDKLNKGYGQPILAAHDGFIRQIIVESRIRTTGNGIYLTSNDSKYETIYWHLSEFMVKPGQQVKIGDVIGLAGNTGFVRPLPTPMNQWNGTHLHFGIRQIGKDNDYDGFIDPLPLLYKENDKLPILFPVDLYYRIPTRLFGYSTGDSVSWLQSLLLIEFPDLTFDPIGVFGPATKEAVKRLQSKYGIVPASGYVGDKTKEFLMKKYSIYG